MRINCIHNFISIAVSVSTQNSKLNLAPIVIHIKNEGAPELLYSTSTTYHQASSIAMSSNDRSERKLMVCDPLWTYISGDREEYETPKRISTKIKCVHAAETVIPPCREQGDDFQQNSGKRVSDVTSGNEDLLQPQMIINPESSSDFHWEIDSTYCNGLEEYLTDSTDNHKVRFSPFKQVSFVEPKESASLRYTSRNSLPSIHEKEINDYRDDFSESRTFSLSTFLENWSELQPYEESNINQSNLTLQEPQIYLRNEINDVSKLEESVDNLSRAKPFRLPRRKPQKQHHVAISTENRGTSKSGSIFSSTMTAVNPNVSQNDCDETTESELVSLLQLEDSVTKPNALTNSKRQFKKHAESSSTKSKDQKDRHIGPHKYVEYNEFGLEKKNLILVDNCGIPSIESSNISSKVLVKVEASSVSFIDVRIREGSGFIDDSISLPCTPGSDFVGNICKIDPTLSRQYGLKVGERVMSICKTGGNSRYILVDADKLVKVPNSLEPAVAVCVTTVYLTAFQALLYNQGNGSRYKPFPLRDKTVLLIRDMQSNLGQALGQLATKFGAETVYVTAKEKDFHHMNQLGLVPLNQDSADWWGRLRKTVDLLISIDEPVSMLHSKLLSKSGEIVVIWNELKPQDSKVPPTTPTVFCSNGKSQVQNRSYSYNLYKQWDINLKQCQKDLSRLLNALEEELFSPHILVRIPLSKVDLAHELLLTKRMCGFVICEPWLVKNLQL